MGDITQYSELGKRVVATARRAEQFGLVQNTQGNFSIRVPGQRSFLITPHGINYPELSTDDLVLVDLDGKTLEGAHEPSNEAVVHALAYTRYPNVGGCAHVESPYINTLYALNRPVPGVLGNFVYLFAGRGLALGPSQRSGTAEFASASLDAMADHFGVVWKNHGLFCVGSDLEVAFDRCVAAEQAARVYYLSLALQLGEPELIPDEAQRDLVEVARANEWIGSM